MIKIDYSKIEASRTLLRSLLQETLQTADPLIQSRGKTTTTEKKIITLLLQIYNKDLPALFNSSERLLAVISDEFQKAEQTAQSNFEE